MGYIPSPDPERSLAEVEVTTDSIFFEWSMDDDFGGADTFEGPTDFLANHCFSRVKWAKLTLSWEESKFFASEIKVLGHNRQGGGGIRL